MLTGEGSIEAETEELVRRGELKAALRLLERANSEGFTRRDAGLLEDVLAGARIAHGHAEGSTRDAVDRITHAVQQNILFVGAIASGQYRPPDTSTSGGARRALAATPLLTLVAVGVWALAILGTAAVLGAIANSSANELSTATWAVEAAGAGAVFGALFGLFIHPPWPRKAVSWVQLAGAGLYALVYLIAIVWGDGLSKSGDEGLVFLIFGVTCAVPMLATAFLADALISSISSITDRG